MYRKGNLIVDGGYVLTTQKGKGYKVALTIDKKMLPYLSTEGLLASMLLEDNHNLAVRVMYEGAG